MDKLVVNQKEIDSYRPGANYRYPSIFHRFSITKYEYQLTIEELHYMTRFQSS